MKEKFCQSRPTEPLSSKVLYPRGVIQPQPLVVPSTSISDLNGEKIAFLGEEEKSYHFFDALEDLILRMFPDSVFLRSPSPANSMVLDNSPEVVRQYNVWLKGVNTSGSSSLEYVIKIQKLGRPGITSFVDSPVKQQKHPSEIKYMAALGTIPVSSLSYFAAE